MSGATGAATEMVQVGDAGNGADFTGFGAVKYNYSIGRCEVTIGQYTAFLNAVSRTDTYGLYNSTMAGDLNVAGITRSGTPGGYSYAPLNNGGDSTNRPVTYLSWFDAARFANWMSNVQPTGAQDRTTTEDGAYNLAVEPQRVESTGTGGYYDFPTRSDIPPGNVIGSSPNQGNYVKSEGKFSVTQQVVASSSQNYLTDVGAYTDSASYYGTFDQLGNVYEWNDLTGESAGARGLRGSCWFGSLVKAYDVSKLSRGMVPAAYETNSIGFRLAGRYSTIRR
ncbi:MAG: SUMF1/EgtB/PvdO family nonheme iron enzyme [Candidatus Eremiobacteraeota bacterium]|nr:SUMF1/EgtB/PvdO family nonheme iron enzyme [Candidatus Eremiobacteraeota bacterium]